MKKHIQKLLWWLMLPKRTAYLEGVLLAERATREGSLGEVLRDLEADCHPTAFYTGINDYIALLSSYRGCFIREALINPCPEAE